MTDKEKRQFITDYYKHLVKEQTEGKRRLRRKWQPTDIYNMEQALLQREVDKRSTLIKNLERDRQMVKISRGHLNMIHASTKIEIEKIELLEFLNCVCDDDQKKTLKRILLVPYRKEIR